MVSPTQFTATLYILLTMPILLRARHGHSMRFVVFIVLLTEPIAHAVRTANSVHPLSHNSCGTRCRTCFGVHYRYAASSPLSLRVLFPRRDASCP
uniref:Uncharacterized protein n=1 Tax=Anopheles albimanus TaxID=7167 RepID=A0A182FZ77_ANOAL